MFRKQGFTLVEIVVVIGIMIALISISTLSLNSLQRKTQLGTTVNTLVSDIKQQQIKAMSGDTEGRSTADSYGVHFNSNNYVLFHGTSYTAGATGNFIVSMESGVTLSTTFPSSNLIFTQISGEINGFNGASNTVTVSNTSGDQKILQFNKYGVRTQ